MNRKIIYFKIISFSLFDWFGFYTLCLKHSVKKFFSQTTDKKPINNPIPGRCY